MIFKAIYDLQSNLEKGPQEFTDRIVIFKTSSSSKGFQKLVSSEEALKDIKYISEIYSKRSASCAGFLNRYFYNIIANIIK